MALSFLALGTIEGRTASLHNAFDRAATVFPGAGLAFAAIDQEMMLEIAGIAGRLGMVAQGRAARRDSGFQNCLDGRHQRARPRSDLRRLAFWRNAAAEQ